MMTRAPFSVQSLQDSEAFLDRQLIKDPGEWLSIFPEAKTTYIIPKLKELRGMIEEKKEVIRIRLAGIGSGEDVWFQREIIKFFDVADLVELQDAYWRLKRYLPAPKRTGKPSTLGREHIQRAKEYPILELAEKLLPSLTRSGATYKALCPFHEERTASFHIFPRNNGFKCFGCNSGGDVIALTQKLLSHSFVESVRYLAPVYE